jgi:hypothetical protein
LYLLPEPKGHGSLRPIFPKEGLVGAAGAAARARRQLLSASIHRGMKFGASSVKRSCSAFGNLLSRLSMAMSDRSPLSAAMAWLSPLATMACQLAGASAMARPKPTAQVSQRTSPLRVSMANTG